ncbi:MAG: MBL fold metallo-hydrolase [Phycisphaerae bacterium]|nr:MBL fold metallo-hydrolase [Phycisphaerae bacterium]
MSVTFTLLGTGTSTGVPLIACDCAVCASTDPRDQRLRCSAMVRYADPAGRERTILIDTSPDLRRQMLDHAVMEIDGVVYTHNHADHIFGLDDLRRFNESGAGPIDLYAEPEVIDWLRRTFAYIFDVRHNPNRSYVARLETCPIGPEQELGLFGLDWTPLRLLHGRIPILGFRIGRLAYCTDCSSIPPETWPHLQDLDVLVIDALRFRHHPTHMTVDQALEVIEQVKPARAYLTHITHDATHAEIDDYTPDHVHPAHDGLVLEVEC